MISWVLERADVLGETWRDNDYPGCCCDIPSHVNSLSFELNPVWTRGFVPQPEIREYRERTTDTYAIRPHIRFGDEVLDARWDQDARHWAIKTRGLDAGAYEISTREQAASQNPPLNSLRAAPTASTVPWGCAHCTSVTP